MVKKCLAKSPLVRHVCGTPLLSWCNFWDTVKCHRMHRVTAELSKCVSTACLVDTCLGRVGVVKKCLVESPLVRQVCDTPLLSWCTFWDTVKALGDCKMEQICFYCMPC